MILYMLDIKTKYFIKEIILSIFCILLNYIYAKYSHGVSSIYMTYMFLIPLIGGIIFLFLRPNKYMNLYILSINTLTLGSFIEGILEIAGTTSNYIYLYGILTILLFIIFFFSYIKKD